MDFFIARQPIFNVHRKLHAYELLYRGTPEHPLDTVDGERATASLLSSAFLMEGVDIISGTRPCFINFTEDLLVKKIPLSFPKTRIVVEILEDVRPTRAVIEACQILVRHGYTLALDDFIYSRKLHPLIELAEIIKIDFRLTPLDEIHKTLYKLQQFKVKLLAEKVETPKEFTTAVKLGFSFFQGYFFSKPENIRIKELTASKLNMLQLVAEVSHQTTTMERLNEIISMDIAISYKLLRFLNSAYFFRVQKVKTISHAIAYLGEKELRRFIILVLVSELASDKPDELVRQALVRAKFFELLVQESGSRFNSSELFMMGLFSFIDVMLDAAMDDVMDKLPLSGGVKTALSQHSGSYATFLDIILCYERGQQMRLVPMLEEIGVDSRLVPNVYLAAVKFANNLY